MPVPICHYGSCGIFDIADVSWSQIVLAVIILTSNISGDEEWHRGEVGECSKVENLKVRVLRNAHVQMGRNVFPVIWKKCIIKWL